MVVHVAHRGGPRLPDPLPRPVAGRRRRARCCSTRTSRPKATTSSRSTPSTSVRDHRLLAWSADVDGGEKYTLRIRDLETGVDTADVVHDIAWCGTAWSADDNDRCSTSPPTTPCAHTGSGDTIWAPSRPTTPWSSRRPTSGSTSTSTLSRSGDWIIIDTRCNTFSEVLLIPADDPQQAPSSSCGHAPTTSSTPSTTGVTGS